MMIIWKIYIVFSSWKVYNKKVRKTYAHTNRKLPLKLGCDVGLRVYYETRSLCDNACRLDEICESNLVMMREWIRVNIWLQRNSVQDTKRKKEVEKSCGWKFSGVLWTRRKMYLNCWFWQIELSSKLTPSWPRNIIFFEKFLFQTSQLLPGKCGTVASNVLSVFRVSICK